MLCPSCHTPNRDDAKFCKKCGHSFLPAQAKTPETIASAQVNSAPISVTASEGAAPSAPTAQAVQDVQAVQAAPEDISSAPTQIISPQQMMELHARRWQQEAEGEQQASENANGSARTAFVPATPEQQDIADLPTVSFDPASEYTSNNDNDTSNTPETVEAEEGDTGDSASGAAATATNEKQTTDGGDALMEENQEPVPVDADAEDEADDSNDEREIEESGTATPKVDENVVETAGEDEDPGQAEGQAANFPVLAVGATLIGRYEISQVVSDEAAEHTYITVDHQGYQRCWNCGSTENREGDEFCIDCGAGLLEATYTLHEYPAEEDTSAESDAQVLHETIVNTFVDQGHTYVVTQEQAVENAFPNGVHLEVASDSDAGDIRRSDPNEDSTLVMLFQRIHESTSTPLGVFIIADGMGGHDNGQLASRLAVSTIAERISRDLLLAPLTGENAGESVNPFDEDQLVGLLQGAVEDANAAICKVNQRDKTDMGSTITGCMIVGDYAYILNVGDSRTYMTRGDQIYRLTTDHSLVQQLVAGGLIEPDDVYTHPQRSQIFRSLGDKLNVQVDIFKQQLHPGDKLLCCCDGVWEMIRDPQLESILNTATDPQSACTHLIEAANANGGEDNISAVVVFVR
jgi:serine/threonine protein phosphatase PrpC